MKLIVVEEGHRSVLEFDGPVVRLGRAIDNDVRLSGQRVSRYHCRLEESGGEVWIVDLGSANGTTLNGKRVDRCRLACGDELSLGSARIHLQAEPERTEVLGAGAGLMGVGLVTHDGGGAERDSLRTFARTTRALLEETDEGRLLRLILDAAVALLGAERGFLLMSSPEGAGLGHVAPKDLRVRLARSFEGGDIPLPSSRFSTGIAERVLELKRPILSVDAGRDERFQEMASVEDLRLRSVMCMPIQVGSFVEGLLYVDNRLQQGAFSEDDLDLAELFAAQAALAIRNARQIARQHQQQLRLEDSQKRIEVLNQQLGRKVRDRDAELAVVRAELGRERGRYDYTAIVGSSDRMRKVFQQLDRIIDCELPVLIHGESGTGKELIARAVHYNGSRKEKPFVGLNCAALPDSLLVSELFGHTRGAFTGAHSAKKGLFEQADGGTLFLDEIGDMSEEMQKKLLRVLQEREVRPLGSDRKVEVDVRLVTASHRNLAELVSEGRFREDLFYRINVLDVNLPPLRERTDDVPLLAESLLIRAAREAGVEPPLVPQEVMALLVAYSWPGNVRELENEMRRLVVLADGLVSPDLLSDSIRSGGQAKSVSGPVLEVGGDLREAVASFEREAILSALERSAGNKSRAASELGISRFALQRKLDKYKDAEDAQASQAESGGGQSEKTGDASPANDGGGGREKAKSADEPKTGEAASGRVEGRGKSKSSDTLHGDLVDGDQAADGADGATVF